MNDSASLTINAEEFRRVAEMAVRASERTYDRFINSRAYHLARAAMEHTERANPDRIARQLGQTGTRLRLNRKTGRLVKGARVFDSDITDSYAARIVNYRRRRIGEQPIWGRELAAAVRRLRASAPRSANFIRAGWIWAMRQLGPSLGEPAARNDRGTRISGAPKGSATPARRSVNSAVSATIVNTSLLAESARRTGSRAGKPMPIAQRGLDIAYRMEMREMLAHLQKKLQPVLNEFSAK